MPGREAGKDGGLDGKGYLWQLTDHDESKVIVEVKSGAFNIDDVRGFCRVIETENAAAGVFITLDGNKRNGKGKWTSEMERVALDFGYFKMKDGSKEYRRLQHWSVRERWGKGEDPWRGHYPTLPRMRKPTNLDHPICERDERLPVQPFIKLINAKPKKRRKRKANKNQTTGFEMLEFAAIMKEKISQLKYARPLRRRQCQANRRQGQNACAAAET